MNSRVFKVLTASIVLPLWQSLDAVVLPYRVISGRDVHPAKPGSLATNQTDVKVHNQPGTVTHTMEEGIAWLQNHGADAGFQLQIFTLRRSDANPANTLTDFDTSSVTLGNPNTQRDMWAWHTPSLGWGRKDSFPLDLGLGRLFHMSDIHLSWEDAYQKLVDAGKVKMWVSVSLYWDDPGPDGQLMTEPYYEFAWDDDGGDMWYAMTIVGAGTGFVTDVRGFEGVRVRGTQKGGNVTEVVA